MRVLAMDSATNVATVALTEDQTVKAESYRQTDNNHSVVLLAMIDDLLQEVEWSSASIDVVAVSIGPGSFTGLRIGMSTAKGLSYGWDKPIVGVKTLDAMADPYGPLDLPVVPLINARRLEAYGAIYHKGVRLGDYFVDNAEKIGSYLEQQGLVSPLFLGDGALALKETLAACVPSGTMASPSLIHHRASAVGLLAEKEYLKRGADDLLTLAPFYIRDVLAKTKKEQEAGKKHG